MAKNAISWNWFIWFHEFFSWTFLNFLACCENEIAFLIWRIFLVCLFLGSGGAGSGSGVNIGGGGGAQGQGDQHHHQDLGISSAFVGLHEGHKDSSTLALTPRESK